MEAKSVVKSLEQEFRNYLLRASEATGEKRKQLLSRAKRLEQFMRDRGLDYVVENVLYELQRQKVIKRNRKGGYEVQSNLEWRMETYRKNITKTINRTIQLLTEARELLHSDAAQFALKKRDWRIKVLEAYSVLSRLAEVLKHVKR
ncbi:hypothetical protein J7L00_04280 [Candidatus Bathyarchaeota archaeon]|nr:hypothetical protein [Candidatus Bathyarchaeota archaeon]